ncbi:MAG: glycosyltransferase family 2 protein [Desulfuromonadales bacterium]|jgi:glycosyltransferase involved in cell wall biosynthesis
MRYSVVVPVYNEEANVEPLYGEVSKVLGDGQDWELIFIDDGSQDKTYQRLKTLASRDERVKVVLLRRNFGQTAAMMAGFDAAVGKIVIPMDGDLQNDPADIPRLVAKLEEGFDVVSGWRSDRKDAFISRKIPSFLANRLIANMTSVHINDYGCTLKAYRREILNDIKIYGELHRFVPALASRVGARVTEVKVNHRPRVAGKTKYGIGRTFRVILDLMTVHFLLKYSTRPMQLFGKWGAGAIALGLLSGASTLFMKFSEGLSMNRNPLLVLTAFLLFAGVQFFALGLLGELVTRTYHEVQDKPIYSVRQRLNFPE